MTFAYECKSVKLGAMCAAQWCLDQIHNLARALGASASTHDTSGVKRRAVCALLKEVMGISDVLFESGGDNVEGVKESLKCVVDVATKLGVSFEEPRCRETEASENALLVKLEMEEDGLDLRPLSYILRSVKQMERSWSFQHSLWQDKQALSLATDCSMDNLTYGTTSLHLWQKVMSSGPVRERLSSGIGATVLVFGSSVGLLAFMTSALYPTTDVKIVGYEIMPTLHSISVALKTAYMPNSNLEFKLQDMLTANIRDADLIVLTSLCWDKGTRKRVALKLSSEVRSLPPPLVIDYRTNTFSEFSLDSSNSHYNKVSRGAALAQRKRSSDSALNRATVAQLMESLGNCVTTYETREASNTQLQPETVKFQLLREERSETGGGTSWTSGTNSNQSISIFCATPSQFISTSTIY